MCVSISLHLSSEKGLSLAAIRKALGLYRQLFGCIVRFFKEVRQLYIDPIDIHQEM